MSTENSLFSGNFSVGKISMHLVTSGSVLAVESKGIEFFAFKRYDEE